MILREAEASAWSVVALCEFLGPSIWPRYNLVTFEALLMAFALVVVGSILCHSPQTSDKEDGVRLGDAMGTATSCSSHPQLLTPPEDDGHSPWAWLALYFQSFPSPVQILFLNPPSFQRCCQEDRSRNR